MSQKPFKEATKPHNEHMDALQVRCAALFGGLLQLAQSMMLAHVSMGLGLLYGA